MRAEGSRSQTGGADQHQERDWRDRADDIRVAEMSLRERALEVQRRNAEIECGVRAGDLITTLDPYGRGRRKNYSVCSL